MAYTSTDDLQICCQRIIHFQEHVAKSILELWDSMEITGAVGKWHLATMFWMLSEVYTQFH